MSAFASLPVLLAQAPPSAPPAPAAAALLALRRWCASLTLSSPELIPRPYGLWSLLAGLGALAFVALCFQGPKRALKQIFDLAGHMRLLAASMRRVLRAGRLLATVCGITVLVWTANQIVSFYSHQGEEDMHVLLSSKSLKEVAVEQGILAALTPLRDLAGLADMLPLLIVAAALVFRLSAERWGGMPLPNSASDPAASGWTTLYWGSAWLYALYRFAAMIDPGDLPLGSCLFLEAGVVPLLMLFADGLLLAWVVVELRSAALGANSADPLDLLEVIALVPAATFACLAVMPARYLATGTLLAFLHVPAFIKGVPLWAYRRLAWGLVAAQGAALLTLGIAGAVAWGRGKVWPTLWLYFRMLKAEGGHLAGVVALAGLAAGGLAGAGYVVLLSLPEQTWVLNAADSYAHYATLAVGLVTLSALIELAERSLPVAKAATARANEPAAFASTA